MVLHLRVSEYQRKGKPEKAGGEKKEQNFPLEKVIYNFGRNFARYLRIAAASSRGASSLDKLESHHVLW